MKIVRLQIKNFLSISDAEIRPGQVTQIVGANNQGKTTVLRALEVAMQGSSDGSLVKRGEDQAEIIVEFDNEMVVRRRIKAAGSQSLEVRKGEFKADAPQGLLDSLLSAGAFNPLELLDPKRRAEILLRAVEVKLTEEDLKAAVGPACPVPLPPLDYSQHGLKVADQAYRYFYQRRAEANKVAKERHDFARVKEAELPPRVAAVQGPSEEELRGRIAAAQAGMNAQRKNASDFQMRQRDYENMAMRVRGLESEKIALQERLAAMDGMIQAAQAEANRVKELMESARPNDALFAQLQEQEREAHQELTRRAQAAAVEAQHAMVHGLKEEAAKAQGFAEQIGAAVVALGEGFKNALMAKVQLPVEGLSYSDGEFFLDGSALDNLSSSKALKLAVAVARKLAGPAKLICIDGAELLDEANYEVLRQEIDGDGFTYFMTKVGAPFAHPGDTVVKMEAGVAHV